MATMRKALAEGAATDAAPSNARKVVICGGGVIGTAIAYYLAKRGQSAIVVEREGIAAAASGKAGGFLALDWNDSSALGPLSRVSYKMHATLEEELGAELDYRCLDTFSVQATDRFDRLDDLLHVERQNRKLGKWVDGHITAISRLGDTTSTAQIHPRKLTQAFMAKARELAGSEVRVGAVRDIRTETQEGSDDVRIVGVTVGEDFVPADVVIVAMGPWSGLASAWLPLPMVVSSQKYHSLVLKPAVDASAAALFTSVHIKGRLSEPEIYPRPHGEVYVCGEPESPPLPSSPSKVVASDEKCDRVLRSVAVVASGLATAEVVAKQACYLPMTPDGLPVMGAIPGVAGGYIATGHSCWGILNGPATGLAMAELVLDGAASSVDIRKFSPRRFA